MFLSIYTFALVTIEQFDDIAKLSPWNATEFAHAKEFIRSKIITDCASNR